MIGKLTGRIDYRSDDHLLLDVGGVGYVVYCSERTLAEMPRQGAVVALYTDLLVREDLLQLFGFLSLAEKEWHRLLMSVQGIGAKASLAILGALGPDGLARAIALGDWNAVRAAKGVGPKIAQRVVLDLKDKAPQVMGLSDAPPQPADLPDTEMNAPAAPRATPPASSPAQGAQTYTARADAPSALGNLGYAPSDAAAAVAQAAEAAPEATSSDLIRAALKALAPT